MDFQGTSGNDDFRGTNKDDSFELRGGGTDIVQGHRGDDVVYVFQALEVGDRFSGGDGVDRLELGEDVPDGFAFNGGNFVDFEEILFEGRAHATIADACDPTSHHLYVGLGGHNNDIDASAVTGSLTLSVDDLNHHNSARFIAGSGDDFLSGGFGRDHLDGGAGNDIVQGSLGNDRLMGGAGDDMVAGGYGYDKLTGGGGADTFDFVAYDDPRFYDNDVVTDFDVTEDKISIYSSDLHGYDQLTFEDDGRGGTIVLFYQNQSVHLNHVAPDTLSESNFIFKMPGGSQQSDADGAARHFMFDPKSSHEMSGNMIAPHAELGDLHILAHLAIA